MKIGILVWDLNIKGGTQRQALELAICLQKMGHNVVVYTTFYNKEKCYSNLVSKLKISYLFREGDQNSGIGFIEKFCKSFFYSIFRVTKLIDRDLDILNVHDRHVFICGAIYKKFINSSATIVWTMNDLPNPNQGHNIFANVFNKVLFLKIIENPLILDEVCVLDRVNNGKLKKVYGRQGVVVRSGLNIDDFQYIPKSDFNKVIRIFANSIFFPHRRLEDIIVALNILEKKQINFKFFHIGTNEFSPAYADKIYKMVKRYNLNNNVRFLGAVSDEELINNYQVSDVFIYPNYPQTWGLSVFEAMACGTPVIVTTGCGASEVLTNEKNALIINPGAPNEIAIGVEKLVNSPALWKKLSRNGRKFVENSIRWDIYTENMVKIFSKALEINNDT